MSGPDFQSFFPSIINALTSEVYLRLVLPAERTSTCILTRWFFGSCRVLSGFGGSRGRLGVHHSVFAGSPLRRRNSARAYRGGLEEGAGSLPVRHGNCVGRSFLWRDFLPAPCRRLRQPTSLSLPGSRRHTDQFLLRRQRLCVLFWERWWQRLS